MGKQALFPLSSPWMNAAGMLGYAPTAASPLPEAAAFVTAPISLQPRHPAQPPRLQRISGGVLVHSGHPNPGWREVRQRHAPRWAAASLPVIVHLLGTRTDEVRHIVWELEGLDGVAALELGLPPHCPPEVAEGLVHAAAGELPLIVQLPRTQALTLARHLSSVPVAAFSLAPPRGAFRLKQDTFLEGRLYGPVVLADTLALLRALRQVTDVPLLAAGGVFSRQDAETCLELGAQAVQLDLVLWRGGWDAASDRVWYA